MSKRLVDRHLEFVDHCMKVSGLMEFAAREAARLPQSIVLADAVKKMMEVAHAGEPSLQFLVKSREGKPADSRSQGIKYMKELLPRVEEERQRGFAFYHSLAAVALWSALGAAISDLLLVCFQELPECLKTDAAKRVRIPLASYLNLSDEERHAYILDEVDHQTESRLKTGVGRFEALLSSFGLGGAVDDELRACILEHSEIRNVLVHRNGRADARLVQNCPWLGYERGSDICVTGRMVDLYTSSSMLYVSLVLKRALIRLGASVERTDGLIGLLTPSIRRTAPDKKEGADS